MRFKPDWKDAPEWANYVAMDDDGSWWWFEKEPSYEQYGEWVTTRKSEQVVTGLDGSTTLEARPVND